MNMDWMGNLQLGLQISTQDIEEAIKNGKLRRYI